MPFRWFSYLIFSLITAIYIWQRATALAVGDGIIYFSVASQHFDLETTATTHFLYVNTLHLLLKIFPYGLHTLVFFSIFCSVVALWILYQMLTFLTNKQAALLSVVVFAFSFTYWRQTEIIEVYTTNMMFTMFYTYFLMHDLYHKKRQYIWLATILYAISYWVHIQNILLLPLFVAYWYTSELNILQKISVAFVWLLLVSGLVLMPLIMQHHEISRVFFSSSFFMGKVLGLSPVIVLKGVIRGVAYLFYNFWFALPLMVYGAWWQWKKQRYLFYWVAYFVLAHYCFATRYDVSDNYVFFLPSYSMMTLWMAYGWQQFLSYFTSKIVYPLSVFAVMLFFPLFYYGTWYIIYTSKIAHQFEEKKAYKGGLYYYLFPGMRNNVDIEQLFLDIYTNPSDFDVQHILYDENLLWGYCLLIQHYIQQKTLPENDNPKDWCNQCKTGLK